MVTIEEYKAQVAEQRRILQERQAEATKAETSLQEAKKALPDVSSQKYLRDKMAGLKGRESRRAVIKTEEEIASKQKLIEGYRGELGSYEQQIVSAETDISNIESQIAAQDAERIAYTLAIKMYNKNIPYNQISDPAVRHYMKELYEERASVEDYNNLINDITSKINSNIEISSNEQQIISSAMKKGYIKDSTTGEVIKSLKDLQKIQSKEGLDKRDFSFMENIDKLSASYQEPITKESLIGGISGYIEKNPILSRIAQPSKLKEDISKVFPKISKSASFFFTPIKEEKIVGIYNPILAMSIPAKYPTKIITPLREAETVSIEVQQPARIFGKETTISEYTIIREVSPPKYVEPIQIDKVGYIKPARIEITKTPFPIIGEKPFITITSKGGTIGKINLVGGESMNVPPELSNIESIPKVKQLLWQRMAERKVQLPVSIKNVPKILGEETQKSQGQVNQYLFGSRREVKGGADYSFLEPQTIGKRITRTQTASQFKQIGETEEFNVLAGETFFKDVTKPFARATGITPKMKNILFISKQPLIIGEDTTTKLFFPSEIPTGGGLSLKTIQEVKSSPMPLLGKVKPPQTKVINKVESIEKYGKFGVLGGVSLGMDVRTNKLGISDFTRGFSKGFIKEATPTTAKEYTTTSTIQLTTPKVETLQKTQTKILEKVDLGIKPIQEQKTFLTTKQVPTQLQEPAQKQIELLKPALVLKVKQLQVQKQVQVQKQKVTQKLQPKQRTYFKTISKEPTIKTPIKKGIGNKLFKIGNISKDDFSLLVRRFGKWKTKGEFGTLGEAVKVGKQYTLSTLGASLKVMRGKNVVDISNMLGQGYRPSKIERGVFVQEKNVRFKTGGELKEATASKKSKFGRKRKFL